MQYRFRKSLWVFLALLAVVGGLTQIPPFFLVKDHFVLDRINTQLERVFLQNGLKLDIRKIRWEKWNTLTASQINVKETAGQAVPFEFEKLTVKLNLLTLLQKGRQPEAALQELILVNPKIRLERYADGTWNLDRYFPENGRVLDLQTLVRVENAVVTIDDAQFGSYRVRGVNGSFDLREYPGAVWDLRGRIDLGNGVWNSRGELDLERKIGLGKVWFSRIPLDDVVRLVPKRIPYRVSAGLADGELKFSWSNKRLWLENGAFALRHARFYHPQFTEPFQVERLKANISPERVQINYGRLRYKQSIMNLSGDINTRTSAMQADISVHRFDLADLNGVVAKSKLSKVKGLVNLRLKLGGSIGKPLLNGEIKLADAGAILLGRPFHDISGTVRINHNDLLISRLEGKYLHSTVGLSGKVANLFNPRLDLTVYGLQLDLTELESIYPGLTFNGNRQTNFYGKIDGNWQRPMCSGKLSVAGMTYQTHQFKDVDLNFAWDTRIETVQILELTAGTGAGRVTLKGNIHYDGKNAVWDLSSRILEMDIAQIKFPGNDRMSGLVSADAIIRGSWHQGKPFEIGSVFGVLKGEHLLYNQMVVDEAQAVFTWKNRRLQVESLQMNVGDGRIYGNITMEEQDILADLSVENVRLRQLIQPSANNPIDGIFKGDIYVEGPLRQLRGTATGKLEQASWATRSLGDLNGEIIYHHGRFEIERLNINSPAGNILVKGNLGLEQEAPLGLVVFGNDIRLKEFATWFPVGNKVAIGGNGQVMVEIEGTTAAPVYSGKINLKQPALYKWVFEQGTIQFEGDLKRLSIKEFQLGAEYSAVQMSGFVAHEQIEIYYSGHVDDLERFGLYYKGSIVRGGLNFHGKISGTAEKPLATVAVNGTNLSFGNFNNQHLMANLIVNYPELQIKTLRLTGDDGNLNIDGTVSLAKPEQLQLKVGFEKIRIDDILAAVKFQKIKAGGSLSGEMTIQGTLEKPLVWLKGELRQGLINDYPVDGIFEFRYLRSNLQIERIEFQHDQGMLIANGLWEDGKSLKLTASLINFPIQPVTALLNVKRNIDGLVNAEIQLEWSQTGIMGDYQCQVSNLAVDDTQLGNIALTGGYSEQGILIAGGSLSYYGGRINVEGFLPWPVAIINQLHLPSGKTNEQPVSLQLSLRDLPTEILNIIPQQFVLAKGRLDGNLDIAGSLQTPVLSGWVECNQSRLDLPGLPLTIDNLEAKIKVISNRVEFEKVTGNIRQGKFSMSGQMMLRKLFPESLDLQLTASKVYYRNHFFNGYGDVRVNMTGNLQKPKISGEVKVFDCKIGVAGGKHGVNEGWQPEFDLKISTGKNVRYRQLGIADLTVAGELLFRGTIRTPIVTGKINSKKGVLSLYGQNFIVKKGLALFKPEHGFQPYIDVESTYRAPKAEIFLTVKGQVGSELLMDLSSRPQMTQSQIYAMLNWSELSGDEPLTVDGMIGGNLSFVTDTIFGDMFNEIRTTLHLDYFYLETNYSENEFRINMGDYVTDDLFISYSRAVDPNNPNEIWGFDYYLSTKLILGGRYSAEDELSWRLTYGFGF